MRMNGAVPSYWCLAATAAGEDVQPTKSELKVRGGSGAAKTVRDPRDDAEAIATAAAMKQVRGLDFHPINAPLGPLMTQLGVFARTAPTPGEVMPASGFQPA